MLNNGGDSGSCFIGPYHTNTLTINQPIDQVSQVYNIFMGNIFELSLITSSKIIN